MSEQELYFGFDPGGKGNFGWCVLGVEGERISVIKSGTCSSAVEALNLAKAVFDKRKPRAIGIDAPLHWVTEGDRPADDAVRKAVGRVKDGKTQSIQHVNSLKGACLAQGVIIARLIRKEWSDCPLAEAHPKALLAVKPNLLDNIETHKFSVECEGKLEHERDAVIAAYAAMRTVADEKEEWTDVRSPAEHCIDLIAKPVPLYWFPTTSAAQAAEGIASEGIE